MPSSKRKSYTAAAKTKEKNAVKTLKENRTTSMILEDSTLFHNENYMIELPGHLKDV